MVKGGPMQRAVAPAVALERKYPEQVVLVTSRSRNGHANVMAVGWIALASDDPLMFMLGIDAGAYTYPVICQTKEFVVAFPHEKMAAATRYVGSHHGRWIDKFALTGLATQRAKTVRAPLIAEAVANFECRLVKIIRPGNCPLLIGRVVAAHVNRRPALKRLYTVGPGHRLAGVRTRAG